MIRHPKIPVAVFALLALVFNSDAIPVTQTDYQPLVVIIGSTANSQPGQPVQCCVVAGKTE